MCSCSYCILVYCNDSVCSYLHVVNYTVTFEVEASIHFQNTRIEPSDLHVLLTIYVNLICLYSGKAPFNFLSNRDRPIPCRICAVAYRENGSVIHYSICSSSKIHNNSILFCTIKTYDEKVYYVKHPMPPPLPPQNHISNIESKILV